MKHFFTFRQSFAVLFAISVATTGLWATASSEDPEPAAAVTGPGRNTVAR